MKVINYQEATIDPFGKGLGNVPSASVPLSDAGRLEWNLLAEDVSLPAAVLYADRIEHNLKWMQAFVAEYGVKLAPHGKTTMAPQLFRRQLDTGAWGITLATAHQARAAYHGGVRRVLLANQLVGRHNMAMIAELLTDPDFEFSASSIRSTASSSSRASSARRASRSTCCSSSACRAGAPACATTRSATRCSPRSRATRACSSSPASSCTKAC